MLFGLLFGISILGNIPVNAKKMEFLDDYYTKYDTVMEIWILFFSITSYFQQSFISFV